MNELLKLISRGENERLEFKESLRLKEEICQAVSAFSNANGGSILIGVSNDEKVIGVDIGNNTLEELAKESGAKVYWDELVCDEAKLEDIEEKKARWFLKEARKQRGLIQNAAKMRQKNTQKGDDSGSESESKGGEGD